MASKLVSGNKQQLLGEFTRLKSIHGKKWRKLLVAQNSWYNTVEGLYAWNNAHKGTAGNESLRQILKDMRKIVGKMISQAESLDILEVPLSAVSDNIVNDAIDDSLSNLGYEEVGLKKKRLRRDKISQQV